MSLEGRYALVFTSYQFFTCTRLPFFIKRIPRIKDHDFCSGIILSACVVKLLPTLDLYSLFHTASAWFAFAYKCRQYQVSFEGRWAILAQIVALLACLYTTYQ